MNVVITGASRGIGLELTRLALEKENMVMAIARRPSESEGLRGLKERFGARLQVVAADLQDAPAADGVAKELAEWDSVDLLINNAGILKQGITPEDFIQSFQVNSVAPFLMVKSLTPWLKKSKSPKVLNITSRMGSIDDNKSGGYYAYRASKAALNMINKSLAGDLGWLTTVVAHPGWVKTDMGGVGAQVDLPDSARGLWQIIQQSGPAQSGRFFNYTGEELPW